MLLAFGHETGYSMCPHHMHCYIGLMDAVVVLCVKKMSLLIIWPCWALVHPFIIAEDRALGASGHDNVDLNMLLTMCFYTSCRHHVCEVYQAWTAGQMMGILGPRTLRWTVLTGLVMFFSPMKDFFASSWCCSAPITLLIVGMVLSNGWHSHHIDDNRCFHNTPNFSLPFDSPPPPPPSPTATPLAV